MAKHPVWREILDWIVHIGIAVVLGLLIVTFLVQRTIVNQYSMEPTLHDGDNLIIEKISYKLGILHPGDIVTLYVPEFVPKDENPIIKRVVALGGDTVEIRDGKVYVNGKLYKEDYINGDYTREENPQYSKVTVPKGSVYVLGDNRIERITDSRTIGPVSVDRIRGKAFFRFYPLSRFGTLN